MVISITANVTDDFVLNVKTDSGQDMLLRSSKDVEDLKEWNLGKGKEIRIDIDSETGIILGWAPITVKQVQKKANSQKRERIESQTIYSIDHLDRMYTQLSGCWWSSAPNLSGTEDFIEATSSPLTASAIREELNRIEERMTNDEERT